MDRARCVQSASACTSRCSPVTRANSTRSMVLGRGLAPDSVRLGGVLLAKMAKSSGSIRREDRASSTRRSSPARAIARGSRSALVPGGRAADVGGGDHRHAAAADAAGHHAGEQVSRAVRLVERLTAVLAARQRGRRLPGLYARPELVRDDPKLRNLRDDPGIARGSAARPVCPSTGP